MDISNVTWRKASRSGGNGGNCVEVGVWRKASPSGANGGECVEVGVWRKTSHSGGNGGACVEVATAGPTAVAVRDSKDPQGPKLAFDSPMWQSFVRQVQSTSSGN